MIRMRKKTNISQETFIGKRRKDPGAPLSEKMIMNTQESLTKEQDQKMC